VRRITVATLLAGPVAIKQVVVSDLDLAKAAGLNH
jgi:hypothetical protein